MSFSFYYTNFSFSFSFFATLHEHITNFFPRPSMSIHLNSKQRIIGFKILTVDFKNNLFFVNGLRCQPSGPLLIVIYLQHLGYMLHNLTVEVLISCCFFVLFFKLTFCYTLCSYFRFLSRDESRKMILFHYNWKLLLRVVSLRNSQFLLPL